MSYKTLDADGDEQREFKLHKPTDDMSRLTAAGKVCGDCKYFSLREGQRLINAQNFVATLVKDHRWKTQHLGSPPEILGDCGAHRSGSSADDSMLTGPLHVACDHWRHK